MKKTRNKIPKSIADAYMFSAAEIASLCEIYPSHDDLASAFASDPYLAVHLLDSYQFWRMLAAEKRLRLPTEGSRRCAAALVSAIRNSESMEGHCWVFLDEAVTAACDQMQTAISAVRNEISEAIAALISEERCVKEIDPDGGRDVIARKSVKDKEEYLAEKFAFAHAEQPAELVSISDLESYTLTDKQKEAVEMAFSRKKSLISGRAGTGKSYVINTITDILRKNGMTYKLCAPTGKAAKRIEETCGEPAVTVHRLLKYDGVTFQHKEKLRCDWVIVDEVSMMDTNLMFSLVKAINFSRTNLLLVGDHNQLPPVGCGNPLRDIIADRKFPKTVLDQVVRQAGVLKKNCTAILDGSVSHVSTENEGVPEWHIDGDLDSEDSILGKIRDILESEQHYHIRDEMQILIPKKSGPIGTEQVNLFIQEIVQRKICDNQISDQSRSAFYPGDKIIQTKNNYKLGKNGIMNGALGVVEAMHEGAMTAEFDGERVVIPSASLKDIALGYALTVHKSQGSEFPAVVFVVHHSHRWKLHHRNLFYTAATRAKKSVYVLGGRSAIDRCAEKYEVDRRQTFLGSLLESCRRKTSGDASISDGVSLSDVIAVKANSEFVASFVSVSEILKMKWNEIAAGLAAEYGVRASEEIISDKAVDSEIAAKAASVAQNVLESELSSRWDIIQERLMSHGVHRAGNMIADSVAAESAAKAADAAKQVIAEGEQI